MSENFGPINLHFGYHFHPSLIFSSRVGDYQIPLIHIREGFDDTKHTSLLALNRKLLC